MFEKLLDMFFGKAEEHKDLKTLFESEMVLGRIEEAKKVDEFVDFVNKYLKDNDFNCSKVRSAYVKVYENFEKNGLIFKGWWYVIPFEGGCIGVPVQGDTVKVFPVEQFRDEFKLGTRYRIYQSKGYISFFSMCELRAGTVYVLGDYAEIYDGEGEPFAEKSPCSAECYPYPL